MCGHDHNDEQFRFVVLADELVALQAKKTSFCFAMSRSNSMKMHKSVSAKFLPGRWSCHRMFRKCNWPSLARPSMIRLATSRVNHVGPSPDFFSV